MTIHKPFDRHSHHFFRMAHFDFGFGFDFCFTHIVDEVFYLFYEIKSKSHQFNSTFSQFLHVSLESGGLVLSFLSLLFSLLLLVREWRFSYWAHIWTLFSLSLCHTISLSTRKILIHFYSLCFSHKLNWMAIYIRCPLISEQLGFYSEFRALCYFCVFIDLYTFTTSHELVVFTTKIQWWLSMRTRIQRESKSEFTLYEEVFFILFYSLRCFYVSFVIIVMATRIKHTNTHTAQMPIQYRGTETNHWHLYIGNDGERQRWFFCSRFSTHLKCFSWTNVRKMLFWCRLFEFFSMKCHFIDCF